MGKIVEFPNDLDPEDISPFAFEKVLLNVPGFECGFIYFDDKTGKYYDKPFNSDGDNKGQDENRNENDA